MKKSLLLSSLLFAFYPLIAQWQPAGATSGNIWYSGGNVGIGTAPSYSLDVAGFIHSSYMVLVDQPSAGSIGGWFRGSANASGTVVIHGNQGNWPAWWISGSQNYLKIAGGGGNETYTGAINIDGSGNVGINTLNTSNYMFTVKGTAGFDQITITNISANNPNATPWADYVFKPSYRLRSIDSLDAYIKANNHLPGIPTSAEIQKTGLDVAGTDAKLLEKIEELTLYTIQLQKQSGELQKQIDELKASNEKLMGVVGSLTPHSRR